MRTMLKAVFIAHLVFFLNLSLEAAPACHKLFQISSTQQISKKTEILESAYTSALSKEFFFNKRTESLIEKWKLQKATPQKVDSLSVEVITAQKGKRNFLVWLKELVAGQRSEELLRLRYESLMLSEALKRELSERNLLRSNTIRDSYLDYRKRHENKYKLAKLVVINFLTIKYFGYPFYLPSFDLIANIQFSAKDLLLINEVGYQEAFKELKKKYKWNFRVHQTLDKYPQAVIFLIASQLSWIYVSAKMEEARYRVPDSAMQVDSVIYKMWVEKFQELNNRAPDLNNPRDKEDWEFIRAVVYRVWVDDFEVRHGRAPDFSKPQDLLELQKFLDQ